MLTREGLVYTWGKNELGQLGHGNTTDLEEPERVQGLNEKQVTAISVGDDFIIALGNTLSTS